MKYYSSNEQLSNPIVRKKAILAYNSSFCGMEGGCGGGGGIIDKVTTRLPMPPSQRAPQVLQGDVPRALVCPLAGECLGCCAPKPGAGGGCRTQRKLSGWYGSFSSWRRWQKDHKTHFQSTQSTCFVQHVCIRSFKGTPRSASTDDVKYFLPSPRSCDAP